jgi:hypothetical protein
MSSLVSDSRARLVLVLTAVLGLFGALGWSTAHAATAITPGDGWHVFSFGAAGSYASQGPFTYASGGITKVTVVDALCFGDEFAVYDNAAPIGSTNVVANEAGCSGVTDPDAALADSRYSHGVFFLPAGAHSIDIQVTDSPFGSGDAFIRVDALSAADCLNGGWKNVPGMTSQRHCIAASGQNVPAGGGRGAAG